jgi:hypothetical protein
MGSPVMIFMLVGTACSACSSIALLINIALIFAVLSLMGAH